MPGCAMLECIVSIKLGAHPSLIRSLVGVAARRAVLGEVACCGSEGGVFPSSWVGVETRGESWCLLLAEGDDDPCGVVMAGWVRLPLSCLQERVSRLLVHDGGLGADGRVRHGAGRALRCRRHAATRRLVPQ